VDREVGPLPPPLLLLLSLVVPATPTRISPSISPFASPSPPPRIVEFSVFLEKLPSIRVRALIL
jgi:hypothetical protein